MNAPLRRVGVVVLVLFGLLFINLNWVQAYKANDYRTNQYNGRVQLSDYQRQRGTIFDVNGVPLARSVATDDSLKYQRKYVAGVGFEPLLGYRPVNLGATGIELTENTFLSGNAADQQRLADIFSDRHNPGGNVFLTINATVQKVAYDDLSNNGSPGDIGAIVAMDPNTGKILAMVSTPGYDANPLADHDTDVATAAYNRLDGDKDQPLLNRAIAQTFPPGSTFKVIVSAAALEAGYTTDRVIPAGSQFRPVPGSSYVMSNAESTTCPEPTLTLIHALTVSCNTAFGQLGVALGAQSITAEAQKWGFGDNTLTIAGDGDTAFGVAASQIGKMTTDSGGDDANLIAQSSIGQFEDRMTPLMGCMMASTVATGGTQMRPYLIDKLQGPDLRTTYTGTPSVLRTPITPQVAQQLQTMMFSVVQSGTGTSAKIAGYQVGGKTGTAENAPGALEHRWFIGFALKDGKPVAAVAVLLANAGKLGKRSAAAIGGDVLESAIAALGGH
jgi:peptidoglycan glycosyltransferase